MLEVRSLKDQYRIADDILMDRLENVLPPLMEECGIDMWVVPSKEYNEDPIFKALCPSSFPTARRTTILVLYYNHETKKVERYCSNRRFGDLEEVYTNLCETGNESQWEVLDQFVKAKNPRTIGLNFSSHFQFCDGLTKGIYDEMVLELSEDTIDRFVGAETLGVRFLETRGEVEKQYYPEIAELAMDIIRTAFSTEVITPGVTTTDDVEWWMKQTVNRLGMPFWFPPTVDFQRQGMSGMNSGVIEKGDLLHCDFGITYLTLCTDTQRLAYVCKDGEESIPEGILEGFRNNNHFQDIVRESFKVGKTGNDVFVESIERGKKEGIVPMLYTHPLGIHGHAAGPTIGLFNDQNPIPVKGDVKVHDATGYALELNTRYSVKEWQDETVFFFTEETVLFDQGEVHFLAKGRDEIILIKA